MVKQKITPANAFRSVPIQKEESEIEKYSPEKLKLDLRGLVYQPGDSAIEDARRIIGGLQGKDMLQAADSCLAQIPKDEKRKKRPNAAAIGRAAELRVWLHGMAW